jgi:hypothetical protein
MAARVYGTTSLGQARQWYMVKQAIHEIIYSTNIGGFY